MTNDYNTTTDLEPWRSKKFAQLTDSELIELSLTKLNPKDMSYLRLEIDTRGLTKQAHDASLAKIKKKMFSKSWWRWIPLVVGILFLTRRILSSW